METKPHYFKQFEKTLNTKLSKFVTKDEIKNLATKDDLKSYAIKEDLKVFATKVELDKLARNTAKSFEGLARMIAGGFNEVIDRLDVRERTDKLEKKVDRIQKALYIGLKDLP